jgi:cell division protein FtsQ
LRKSKPASARHGAGVDAPDEFVLSESPPPAAVGPRTRADAPASRPSGLAVLWAGAKLAFGLAVVASLSIALAWGAHRYALSTPRFAIRDIEVKGNRHHSGDQIARLAGLARGQNLFSIEASVAEKKLLENPWIQKAKVGRELPGRLLLDVVERDAVAVATLEDGSLYLLTAEGEPFKAVEAGDPSDLPIVTGIGPQDLAIDRARAVDRLAVGLEVIREYEGLPISRVHEAQEVHLESDGAVVLTVGKRGISLHIGQGPFRQKLLMAARVIGKLQASGEVPGIVFLDNEAHPERVVVRMR